MTWGRGGRQNRRGSARFEVYTHGLTLHGGSSLGESTGEEGGDDGEGGAIDLTNPNGGRELLDGVGDGSRVGHALDEDGDEGLDVGVGENVAKVDSSVESSL